MRLLGNLSLNALPSNPIIIGANIFMGLFILTIIFMLFYFKKWTWLWKEWITTVDHKKIGIMYIISALVMFVRGFSDAILMRLQQVFSFGHSFGYLPPDHYDQIFTAHGVIMIFFMAMPFMFGLVNIAIPLQIGARDVAFPYMNSLSFWLFLVGAFLVNISLVIGKFAGTGWLAYPPLSGIIYSPGVGVDYYIWALQISGIGTLLSGINFFVTIIKMRCPGMSFMKLPIFCWTTLCTMILVIIAFPILTATLGLLFMDRFFHMHFFTANMGGNAMMYVNLIWAWGHPEVYILILPAFGIFSEVTATFCKKKLFGYTSMVWATVAITFLSFIVWLHHFFTMGAGANVNAFFGIATMIISIPTGVKVFNWIFTMFRGKIEYHSTILWTIGFIITFTIGGMTGVMMAVPGIDFQVHNSVFLVAHFHNMIIGGVVFGYFAGLTYWFPKIFGFRLNEKLGKYAFLFWLIGFYIAFIPLYILGLKGMTRRLYHYSIESGFHPYLIVASLGTCILGIGILFQIIQLIVSFKNRKNINYISTNDPWNGRTLEWSISSPPKFYNFLILPKITYRDDFWEKKEKLKYNFNNKKHIVKTFHMPKKTSTGFIIGFFSSFLGFSIVWKIYWLIGISAIAIILSIIIRTFNFDIDYYVDVSKKKINC